LFVVELELHHHPATAVVDHADLGALLGLPFAPQQIEPAARQRHRQEVRPRYRGGRIGSLGRDCGVRLAPTA
jgi:hypothetical protein